MWVQIGDQNHKVTSGTAKSALSERSVADLTVDLKHLPGVDLSTIVQIFHSDGQTTEFTDLLPSFTGHAVTSHPTGATLSIHAEGALEMVESMTGYVNAERVVPQELIHLLGRLAGFTEERLDIEGIDALPSEVFIVEVPVVGLAVERVVKGLGVEIHPLPAPSDFGRFHEAITNDDDFPTPSATARTYVVAARMFDAETEGVARIEQALDALLATAVYGYSRDPWQRELPYNRSQLQARPQAVPLVHVYGLRTGRDWVHALGDFAAQTHLEVGPTFERWSELLAGQANPELTRALRALRDAADQAGDPFDRCHALSTALEYYAVASKPPPVVQKAVMRKVNRAIRGIEMTNEEQERLGTVLGNVNQAPLFAKVRHQATLDFVPVSEAEWNLLSRLRAARNKTVHGHGGREIPTADDLRWGVSIASRMLLYRWAADNASQAPQPGGR